MSENDNIFRVVFGASFVLKDKDGNIKEEYSTGGEKHGDKRS